jgi:hypothetical protein
MESDPDPIAWTSFHDRAGYLPIEGIQISAAATYRKPLLRGFQIHFNQSLAGNWLSFGQLTKPLDWGGRAERSLQETPTIPYQHAHLPLTSLSEGKQAVPLPIRWRCVKNEVNPSWQNCLATSGTLSVPLVLRMLQVAGDDSDDS